LYFNDAPDSAFRKPLNTTWFAQSVNANDVVVLSGGEFSHTVASGMTGTRLRLRASIKLKANHKYYVSVEFRSDATGFTAANLQILANTTQKMYTKTLSETNDVAGVWHRKTKSNDAF